MRIANVILGIKGIILEVYTMEKATKQEIIEKFMRHE
jgi:hypothetical protein